MALFEIDESSGLPVWVQLRNRFVYLIKTGHYQPGDQLPSVRTLAAAVGAEVLADNAAEARSPDGTLTVRAASQTTPLSVW